MKNQIFNKILILSFMTLVIVVLGCKEEEEEFPRTRLFKPALSPGQLIADGNSIIVDFSKQKGAIGYKIEVSRDTFQTTDYSVEVDTNYVVIDEDLVGEELFWNTIYQVRATSFADDPAFNSKVSDMWVVRTERFPSNMNIPAPNDVIDVAAKVTWVRTGSPITQVRLFAPDDPRLERPLAAFPVSDDEEASGTKIVTGLTPTTEYQIAIYSSETLRGWANYTTLASAVDKSDPNVVDLSENSDPDAVANAVTAAADGNIILVKKGVTYNLPSDDLTKSITIQADLGFEANQAVLYTTGNWNIAEGANIDHVRFIDVEIRGEDYGGDYVFNPNRSTLTQVREVTFDRCRITNLRGVFRIRTQMFIEDYTIKNCQVDSIGGYGIITCDTDGEGMAAVDNIYLLNSTFSKVTIGIQTRQNTQFVQIDGCTFNEFPENGRQIFRYRGAEGFDNSINGIEISNSIFGHAWDPSGGENYEINAADGLTSTNVTIVNVYATSDFTVSSGDEIPGGFPSTTYSGTADDLWVDPYNYNFNFGDTGFSGRTDSGDPKWRTEF